MADKQEAPVEDIRITLIVPPKLMREIKRYGKRYCPDSYRADRPGHGRGISAVMRRLMREGLDAAKGAPVENPARAK